MQASSSTPHDSPTVMAIKAYQYQAKLLLDDYLLADTFIPYTSVIGGVLSCKMIYNLTQLLTPWYYKGYAGLTKLQRVEWGNRGTSTAHAIFISIMALYLIYFSDLFSDSEIDGLIMLRSSSLSVSALGVSVGYFISDLGMIIWSYPSLGGMEYVARILLFVYMYHHMYLHNDQAEGISSFGLFLVLVVPFVLAVMNLMWFRKIIKGLKRTLAKRQ
ncbi:Transmembrane protein [Nymphaea thermarum]|nr:Transmembrane protein [Nymphaea thermarum]